LFLSGNIWIFSLYYHMSLWCFCSFL